MNRNNTLNLAITPLLQVLKFSSWIPESFDISCKFLDSPEHSARLENNTL